MLLEKTKIYGVDGVGQSNPSLTRTDAAVGLTYTIGASEIISDFSHCYPWSEMQEVVDELGNVFIRIPKFYSKVTKYGNGTYKYQISGCRYDGFSTLFIDGKGNEIDYVLVGKYEGSGSSSHIYSKSGQTVLVDISIDDFRIGCRANGEGYQQYDLLIDTIIKQLFMIEFATTDSQSIMKGWTFNSAAIITGHTDTVKTPSGSANSNHADGCDTCNTDGHHACKYRGIENPWGNVYILCDGFYCSSGKVFICTDPTSYIGAKKDAPYFYVGDSNLGGVGIITAITPFEKMPLLGCVTAMYTYIEDTSYYYCDNFFAALMDNVLALGGSWCYQSGAGLWCCTYAFNNGKALANGGRLCYKPI